ncbi:MAG: glycoside hydrolase family 99-like domain-containing protein [Nitrosomonadales bacterium]|nr:glycoside hydrolase family 99-like domain-containing protein [Nitrosomonadales bacterium]
MKNVTQLIHVIRESGMLDAEWYLKEYPDVTMLNMDPVEHYVRYGEKLGRRPGVAFDPQYYVLTYPDIAEHKISPLYHYIVQGKAEGRQPFASNHEAEKKSSAIIEAANYVPRLNAAPLVYKPVRLIAFYLPQFHSIPENDAWWGEGFTEWTNVKPAQPQFVGHYQPHIPGELGYYSLLDVATQHRQIELAKLYGLEGFCFYFYWFGGKRLLETPIENYLNDPALDFPFCLCWANENWSRRWDGLESEILMAQQHSPEDDLAFIRHVAKYMRDPRYIRIDGKPLLLVYRPSLLPSARETTQRWRKWCRDNGIGEIYLAYTQSFETVDPAQYDFDAAIEFPPNNSAPPNITGSVAPLSYDFGCTVYDWRIFVERSEQYQRPGYTLHRSVCPSWDNTARRKNRATVFLNSNPDQYQRWLENAIHDTEQRITRPDERLLFVNAWNEWAEGAHLEPDSLYGYAYLQATRNALERSAAGNPNGAILVVTHDCHPHGAQFLILETAKKLKANGIAVTILALGGGRLFDDFKKIGRTLNAEEIGEAAVNECLAGLRAEGVEDAITSTVVCGSIVPELKNLGFRVLSLIHELPGVIHNMKQEANAANIARYSDKIVFPAELVRQRFETIAPVSPEKAIIRPQGLLRQNPYKKRRDDAYREICEKHNLPKDSQIVLNIGYVDSRKGADLFVEMANRVLQSKPNTVFIWVGHFEKEMEKKVSERIQALGLQNRILFVGFDKEPMAYYAAASVYALTSREDPFPNVVLESAEVNVPVVAFQGASGANDFIVEQGGRLASYEDVADFAGKVAELLAEPQRSNQNDVASLQQYALDLMHHLNGFQRISVVVPNYNYAKLIGDRLDSIRHQTYPVYELIVLDDASSDDSAKVIQKYFDRTGYEARLIVNEQNSGSVFRQWKKGAALCKGDLIWIAEADDLAEKEFLAELSKGFTDTDVVLAFSQSKQINENGVVMADNYLDYTKDVADFWQGDYIHNGLEEIRNALCIKNTIPNVSAVIFQRNALEQALAEIGEELFGYRVAGDWIIYLHVLKRGSILFKAASLNMHRRHTSSVTKSTQVESHFQEVCRAQNLAAHIANLSADSAEKAHAYKNYLQGYFGLNV